jgi:HAD superfamily hydrolase (TIGR01509 family)
VHSCDGQGVRTGDGEEYTDKGLIDHAEAFAGAATLLRALRDRGIRTALASSAKLDEVEKSLAQLGGPGAVDVTVLSADVSTTKPDADVFDTALEKLGRPSRALVIGDTVYDVASARKAGLPCVCVLSPAWWPRWPGRPKRSRGISVRGSVARLYGSGRA